MTPTQGTWEPRGLPEEAVLSWTLKSEFQQTEMQRKGRLRGQAGPTGPRSSRRYSEAAVRKVLEEGRHLAPERLPRRRQPSRRGYGCSGKKGSFWPQIQRRMHQKGSNTAERQAGRDPTMAAGDPPRVRRASMITE